MHSGGGTLGGGALQGSEIPCLLVSILAHGCAQVVEGKGGCEGGKGGVGEEKGSGKG